ncbi:MAG: zinc ribbon domain-containing protein [Nitrospirae bacterium]|nr:MAG: zinc ribbon domain-containing protein [Nitrospirota bacterium]
MELWRRLVLVFSVLGAVWIAYLVSLSPVVTVAPVNLEEKQKKERRHSAGSLLGEERAPRPDRQESMKNRVFTVNGDTWGKFTENVITTSKGRAADTRWLKHVSPDEKRSSVKSLFFRPDELPDNSLMEPLKNSDQGIIITMNHKDFLELRYRRYKDDDFSLGSGFVPYPDPPSYLLYPYRGFSLWFLLLGFSFYILYPRPKKTDDTLYYPLWRVVFGDIVSLLMTVPFFSIPIFVSAGSMQALTTGLPLVLVLWPMTLFGFCLVRISAWYASYRLQVRPDSLLLSTYKGKREYPFSEMVYRQPLIIKPPRWLVILNILAALSGKGSSSAGAAGRAMILASTEYGCLVIGLKNGSSFIINLTDQMGSIAVKGADLLFNALKQAGIPEIKEVKTIESLGLMTMELDQKHSTGMPATVPCAQCGSMAGKDDVFCGKCGAPVNKAALSPAPAPLQSRVCPHCNKTLGLNAKFCSGCGNPG